MTRQPEFERLVNDKFTPRENSTGNRSLGGSAIEEAAVAILKTHPEVTSIDTQVFHEEADGFGRVDIVVNLINKKKFYIHVQRDLWGGTAQQDRLKSIYYWTHTPLYRSFVGYLCYGSFENLKVNTNKQKKIKETLEFLTSKKVLFSIDQLWDHLTNISQSPAK